MSLTLDEVIREIIEHYKSCMSKLGDTLDQELSVDSLLIVKHSIFLTESRYTFIFMRRPTFRLIVRLVLDTVYFAQSER